MYNIFFSNRLLAKHRHIQQMCATLSTLSEGTELHVHTNNETYYNVKLVQVDTLAKTLTIIVDPFYKKGGTALTLNCRDIVAVEFPTEALVAAGKEQTTTIGTKKTEDEDE
ncbi:hypothetical protein JEG43_05435 [Anoxybacillus sp. LAT_35]|uniref:hypothetical protein n=1 Tax=Anoxybacillus TaxID=150247 RepID=UPI001EDA496F|nr:hypothetical protein [Anoxybacillus sp. LAT_26]MCG3085586.1 hypothetical protein [Anoxybacillus sp. LAT27]MCG5025978.1 hypothetical protein [Anoxybacillus flavithermus]MCG6170844.1 hypothetical protein [Anoxybacillus sp. LAT_11]MCG6175801.1 hypothetical protein [Anoxybacillus sp. LAT_31]MCG6177504.1 hypothetical protein [Anoxybacillus sp. LAT_35]MCG6181170.1 hypothetical protein [Anoxybacillus sp. LAT_33]MCG6197164.1 hypothetical protein [Anoxybacillus sp. LAT_38]MCL9970392.1 hypothetica